jgi:polyferredoxin
MFHALIIVRGRAECKEQNAADMIYFLRRLLGRKKDGVASGSRSLLHDVNRWSVGTRICLVIAFLFWISVIGFTGVEEQFNYLAFHEQIATGGIHITLIVLLLISLCFVVVGTALPRTKKAD